MHCLPITVSVLLCFKHLLHFWIVSDTLCTCTNTFNDIATPLQCYFFNIDLYCNYCVIMAFQDYTLVLNCVQCFKDHLFFG